MKLKVFLVFLAVFAIVDSEAQSRLDSLINLRTTERIDGQVPTLYTPGFREVATKFQALVTDAVRYYESKYHVKFNVKLMVLDSTQWLREIIPYGFVFHGRGWLVLNPGMSYESFKKVYELQVLNQPLENSLKKLNITSSELMATVFRFYAIHELGHNFMGLLSNAKSPDSWTSEFSASYFAYEYFLAKHPTDIKVFEAFCATDRDHFLPKYRTLSDFNEKYTGTGIGNYLWYHSSFYFLVKILYQCHGTNFFPQYAKDFPKDSTAQLSTEEVISILDQHCKGKVRKWVSDLESTGTR